MERWWWGWGWWWSFLWEGKEIIPQMNLIKHLKENEKFLTRLCDVALCRPVVFGVDPILVESNPPIHSPTCPFFQYY